MQADHFLYLEVILLCLSGPVLPFLQKTDPAVP
jgi:hypothetical protein